MTRKKAPNINRGDRVRFAKSWLESTFNTQTGRQRMRGVVLSDTPLAASTPDRCLFKVQWDNGECFNVLNVNLAKIGGRK